MMQFANISIPLIKKPLPRQLYTYKVSKTKLKIEFRNVRFIEIEFNNTSDVKYLNV